MKSVCVYSASSAKIPAIYAEAADRLGRIIAKKGIRLINGAGYTGLMGVCADACLEEDGSVTGVIPHFMVERGWCHQGLTNVVETENIHERKKLMASMSDAAIALPGGCGTLEELLEIITWRQLGLYNKPVVILNTNGYFDSLLQMLEKALSEGFMREDDKELWKVASDPDEAIKLAFPTNK